MTDMREAVSDIIAELRFGPFSWSVPSEIPGVEKCNYEARKIADRLEAAVKRESDELADTLAGLDEGATPMVQSAASAYPEKKRSEEEAGD